MSRIARVVIPGLPHHVEQRGNYHQKVFLTDDDRRHYLEILAHEVDFYGARVLAYCLMDNHVHFVIVPEMEDSLSLIFNQAHMRYTQYFNHRLGETGHLWQGRFASCVCEKNLLPAAIRYVERNPVRLGLTPAAENYEWSSARSHTGGLNGAPVFTIEELPTAPADWQAFLKDADDPRWLSEIRANTRSGRPCGDAAFITELEKQLHRPLHSHPRGRPLTV